MPLPSSPDRLLLTPLGGVGVIGMNNMLLGLGDDLVLLDCGVMFADHRQPGADLLLPPLGVLDRLRDRLRAIVLTHGHEDHLGAVPWVASRLGLPVYGTRFTLALLAEKAKGRGGFDLDLREIGPGSRLQIGALDFSFLRVTHSIPDCVSLAVRSPAGNLLFTGDWKRDPGLPCGTRFDLEGFRAFGDEGVLVMLSDSTNAEVPGFSRPESEVAVGLAAAIAEAEGRVLIGLFSSNLYRVHAAMTACKAQGRKVALVGRSLHRYLDACRQWGGLRFPEEIVVDARHLDRYEDDEICVLCTGSQGEARAALARIADGSHPSVRARRGDTVLLSARKIPGNERAIFAMIDALARRGVKVVHRDDPWPIHASGHAASGELSWLLEAVRPRFFMPVHGVYPFMQRHAELAIAAGAAVPWIATNGDVISVDPEAGPTKVGEVSGEPWVVDNDRLGTMQSLGVDERASMAYGGAVAVSGVIEGGRARVRLSARGLYTDQGRIVEEIAGELTIWLQAMARNGLADAALEEELAATARRAFKRRLDKRPTVMAHLLRLGAS